ncbi:MAG: hypothetical protein JNN08_01085 [Bryobacterales bacterium]|nr:hypothetical protein [Bryobacterales bacterium]
MSLKRPRYFTGKLLTAEDLSAEQEYQRSKRRLHNRELHGFGVVSGLTVAVHQGSIIVSSGFAIDPEGNEIAVPDPITIIPAESAAGWICLLYNEVATDPVPVAGAMEYSSIEERPMLEFCPEPSPAGIPLARVLATHRGLELDPSFQPPRVGRCWA